MSGYTSDSEMDPNLEAELRSRRGTTVRARDVVIADVCHGARRVEPTTASTSRRVKLQMDDALEISSVEDLFKGLEESPNNPLSGLPTTDMSGTTVGAQKRRREVFDCVLILSSKASKRPKMEEDGNFTIARVGGDAPEDFKTKMKLWENSNVTKKKNNPVLLPETVRSRIQHIGFDVQEQYFKIDKIMREVMVTRRFMSNVYGGCYQRVFPSIGKDHYEEHGMNDFMFLNTDFQPQAPEVPGAPGLWFNPKTDGYRRIHRVFTKINITKANVKWLYVGQYDMRPAKPSHLSMQEWRAQPAALQNMWARSIANKDRGGWVRARILARKLHGREPHDDECQELVDSGRYRNVTADEVKASYHSGKELMAVWTMKCVGYDNKFQKAISETYPKWFPPPKTE